MSLRESLVERLMMMMMINKLWSLLLTSDLLLSWWHGWEGEIWQTIQHSRVWRTGFNFRIKSWLAWSRVKIQIIWDFIRSSRVLQIFSDEIFYPGFGRNILQLLLQESLQKRLKLLPGLVMLGQNWIRMILILRAHTLLRATCIAYLSLVWSGTVHRNGTW